MAIKQFSTEFNKTDCKNKKMMELKSYFFCWSSCLSYLILICLIQNGSTTELASRRSNPCVAYSRCISPITVPTTRIMTALFSFNFFRFAGGEFLLDICQELDEKSHCGNLLKRCRDEEWPQASYFQNSAEELAQWVCLNKARFESHTECWDDPFLAEMSSCTGLEHLLQPTECLMEKIQDLQNCSMQDKELFEDLLSAAHSS